MEYQKTNINAFGGLDSNARPELIKNEEASDIENLRFEKLGYLINRNGVANQGVNLAKYLAVRDVNAILRGIGAMGLCEYVITKPWGPGSGTEAWPPYDDVHVNIFNPTVAGNKFTDRFMVYALRLPSGYGGVADYTDNVNFSAQAPITLDPDSTINRYTWRYKCAYLLVPLTGPDGWRDVFAFAPNGTQRDAPTGYEPRDFSLPTLYATVGMRSILRADDKPSKLQMYAPGRWLGVHNVFTENGTAKDQNWIEHYVTMNQYRDGLVISDMTNGDMLLVDEYSESEYAETKKHRFTLRENALAKFDIDDVVVDFGLGPSNFNGKGVEAPMALYRFYLTRSRAQETQDNFVPYYTEATESPTVREVKSNVRLWTMKPLLGAGASSFMKVEYLNVYIVFEQPLVGAINSLEEGQNACGMHINGDTKYVFTTNLESTEYDNLLAPLTLKNPNVTQDDQRSPDVYLWKDQKVTYYPVSGKTQSQMFLTAADREWDKSSSGGTKLIKLTTKTGVEQSVPLGVWRYRLVWYLGSGEYSAPSSELVVPDLLFSGLADGDIVSAFGSYKRPCGIDDPEDAEQSYLSIASDPSVNFMNELTKMQGAFMFDSSGALTVYGQNFIRVKKALYDPAHVMAAKHASTNGTSWPASWTSESILAKGQATVVCTLYWPDDYITVQGTFAEAAQTDVRTLVNYYFAGGIVLLWEYDKWGFKEYLNYKAQPISLRIPLFGSQIADSEATSTYNSVFTSYGVLRTAYQNSSRNNTAPLYSNQTPAYQIVFDGAHRFGKEDPIDGQDGHGWVGADVVQNGAAAWFNVVPFDGGVPTLPTTPVTTLERNNYPDDEANQTGPTPYKKFYEHRNATVLRGVQRQSERLSYIKPGVPAEATSRLILIGEAELTLCDFGDEGTWVSQKKLVPYGEENLARDTKRTFTQLVPDVASRYSGPYYAYDAAGQGTVGGWRGPNTNDYIGDFTNYIIAPGLSITRTVGNDTPTSISSTIKFSNLRVVISGGGERLTIPEQLSMYVPASLLFEAPHVKLVVPANRVPRRARQLLIFRTRASHDNAWQPHEYGLVKSIDIIRDAATWKLSGSQATAIEFLDDVKSSELDYSYSIPDYDGFVEPIKSRFCTPLNERVFYANIKEAYKPHAPRNSVRVEPISVGDATVQAHLNKNFGSDTSLAQLWSYKVFTPAQFDPGGTPANTTFLGRYLYYFVAYSDQARSFSLAAFSGEIDRTNNQNRVVLFGMPSAYDPAIEHLNVYRLALSTPLSRVAFTQPSGQPLRWRSSQRITSGVYYVAQGLVEYNGVVYYPNSIIQAQHGGDSGYGPTYINFMFSYFQYNATETDRGHAGSYCEPVVYDITNHFDQAPGPAFIEKIGTIKPEDEGIFYDEDLPSLGRLPLKQFFQNEDHMPSGLRWSEPYQPNKIKLPSLMEVRAGDGDQITGMAMLYGNLIILKERSIHRLAVQGAAVPVSRVDEISNNVGCIAPNTVITVNNTLYFLSWSGFYRYDNNVLSKVDGKFAEELQLRLRSAQNGVMNPAIRDASCGWNSAYRELYLNIPIMTTQNNEGDFNPDNTAARIGVNLSDNKGDRTVRGMIYAINIDTGLVTKHRYMDDALYFTDPATWMLQQYPTAPTQRAPRVHSRLYYTNSLGQMRSAEILPPRANSYFLAVTPEAWAASQHFMRSSVYIESPTKDSQNRDKSNDDFLTYVSQPPNTGSVVNQTTKFVRVFWASKDWTAEDKSVLKRIRKVFAYISASDDPTILRGLTHTSPMGVTATTDTSWQYSYIDSRLLSPRLGYSVTGEIMAVPTESAGSSSSPSQNRGERYTFNVEGSGAFQMEYFGFYWKPINQYER